MKKTYRQNILVYATTGFLLFLLFGVILLPEVFYNIRAGYTGVMFRPYARGTDMTYYPEEGWVFTSPWNKLTIYDVRLRRFTEHYRILTSYGLKLEADVNILIKLNREVAPKLHKTIGEDYYEKYVLPRIEGKIRRVLSKYREDEIYTKSLRSIGKEVTDAITDEMQVYFDVVLVDFLEIRLPEDIEAAIVEKLKEEQLYKAYEFKLAQAREEVNRMKLMTEGIKKYSNRAYGGDVKAYLRQQGIEAAKELALSKNARVITGSNTSLDSLFSDISDLTTDATKATKNKK